MKSSLKSLLKGVLTPTELAFVYKSYDVVGDIAIIRVPEELSSKSKAIANALMSQHKNVKAVWAQSSPISGEYRLRELKRVAGAERIVTVHKENGCLFKVDLKNCYFSPRLAYERMRIASLVNAGEVVINMFAGVGTYSITIAKHSQVSKVYSIDINPMAVKYMQENRLSNNVLSKVIPFEGDAEEIIEKKLEGRADRVLMPLPERAHEYLNSALTALKPQGGWIHYYEFEHASKNEDPIDKVRQKIFSVLKGHIQKRTLYGRIVRQTGPNWYQIAIDIPISLRKF